MECVGYLEQLDQSFKDLIEEDYKKFCSTPKELNHVFIKDVEEEILL